MEKSLNFIEIYMEYLDNIYDGIITASLFIHYLKNH